MSQDLQDTDTKEWPFEVGGIQFAAIPVVDPRIPGKTIWDLKLVETGQVFSATSGRVVSCQSRPKMVKDLEYLLERIHRGDQASFRIGFGLPEVPQAMHAVAATPDPDMGKPRPGGGIAFVGDDQAEVWDPAGDVKRHWFILGSTGAGKTEALVVQAFTVQTRDDGGEFTVDGASIPEEQLDLLLRTSPGIVYAKNQDGVVIELMLDMDEDSLIARAVELTAAGPVYLTAPPAVRRAWQAYDDTGNATIGELAEVLDGVDLPPGVASALRGYKAEVAEDAQWGGRGELMAAGDHLADAVKAWLGNYRNHAASAPDAELEPDEGMRP